MAKITFVCPTCKNKTIVTFQPGEKVATPICCESEMKREFKVGQGNSIDNETFDVARMMSYHTSIK